jgi:hypothetical protein
VDAHTELARRVAAEQDDLLETVPLVSGQSLLEDRLFDQLVDLLVEGLFLDVRRRYLSGELRRAFYLAELAELADDCRRAGLLPLQAGDR